MRNNLCTSNKRSSGRAAGFSSSLLDKNNSVFMVTMRSVGFLFLSLIVSTAYAQLNSAYEVSNHPQCQVGNIEVCVKLVIREMERRLKKLGCDHDAIFAFTYLATTKTFLETANDIGYDDLSSVVREDSLFADYYFRAYDAYYGNGNYESVPPAWQIAFDTSSNKQLFSFGNALVGISAHINNDLPQVLFDLYLDGNPVSEVDHFLVNDFLAQVSFDEELRAIYDPTYFTPPSTPGEPSIVEIWRATAWSHYETMVGLYTGGGNDIEAVKTYIATIIEPAAEFIGNQFVAISSYPPGLDSTDRDEYCSEQFVGND